VTIDEPLTISVPGHPQGKGRARAFLRGSHIGHYTPEKTRTYEGIIRTFAVQEMRGRVPYEGPVRLHLTAFFAVPSTWSKIKTARALTQDIHPAKKPDLDNIVKAVSDALNGVVFKDDAQIVRTDCAKVAEIDPFASAVHAALSRMCRTLAT
jgi:Holliday junction resolvase RusA-like endonuclease